MATFSAPTHAWSRTAPRATDGRRHAAVARGAEGRRQAAVEATTCPSRMPNRSSASPAARSPARPHRLRDAADAGSRRVDASRAADDHRADYSRVRDPRRAAVEIVLVWRLHGG